MRRIFMKLLITKGLTDIYSLALLWFISKWKNKSHESFLWGALHT